MTKYLHKHNASHCISNKTEYIYMYNISLVLIRYNWNCHKVVTFMKSFELTLESFNFYKTLHIVDTCCILL